MSQDRFAPPLPKIAIDEISDPIKLAKVLDQLRRGISGGQVAASQAVQAVESRLGFVEEDVRVIENVVSDSAGESATVSNIDLTSTGTTLLLSFGSSEPDGLIVDDVWLLATAISGTGADPAISLEIDTAEDVARSSEVRGFIRTPINKNIWRVEIGARSVLMRAGDTLSLVVDSAAGHATFTVTAYVFSRRVTSP